MRKVIYVDAPMQIMWHTCMNFEKKPTKNCFKRAVRKKGIYTLENGMQFSVQERRGNSLSVRLHGTNEQWKQFEQDYWNERRLRGDFNGEGD